MQRIIALITLGALLACPASSQTGGSGSGSFLRTHVERNGIRWDFDKPERVGQYANGDWWVVGPITLTSITPQTYTNSENRQLNGTHLDPDPTKAVQGLDSDVYFKLAGFTPGWNYESSLNIAAALLANGTYTVPASTSIVSCKSRAVLSTSNYSQIRRIEVLTVVSTPPAPNSFRPAYTKTSSGSKASVYTTDDIDFSKLPNLPVPPGVEVPPWDTIATMAGGVWYEAPGEEDPQIMRCSRPIDVVPDYGQKVQAQYYTALTYVMLNSGTNDQKRSAVINLIQIGLDRYAIALENPATRDTNGNELHGGHYSGDAGQGCGAKFSIYFSGWLLGDQGMMDYVLPSNTPETFVTMGWQEDDEVFVVSQTSPTEYNYGICGYGPGGGYYIPEGTPEWGIKHYQEIRRYGAPLSDDPHWTASDPDPAPGCCPKCNTIAICNGKTAPCTKNVAYRTCCTANVWWMGNLFSRVIASQRGLSSADLYRPAFYHYADRYYLNMTGPWSSIVAQDPTTLFYKPLFERIWLQYDSDPQYPIPPLN